MGTRVEGNDIRDVLRQAHANDSRPYISIDPIDKRQRLEYDYRVPTPTGCKSMPTESFVIRWNNGHESFTREVDSCQELLSVLRPILQDHARSKRAYDRQMALEEKKKLEARRNEIRARIKQLEDNRLKYDEQQEQSLKQCRKDLAALG